MYNELKYKQNHTPTKPHSNKFVRFPLKIRTLEVRRHRANRTRNDMHSTSQNQTEVIIY